MEIQFPKTNLQNAYFSAYFHECFFGVFRVHFHSLRHEKNLTANSFEIHLHFDAFIQSRNKNSKTNWTDPNRNHLILFNLIHQFQQSKGRSILIHPYQGRDERMIQKIRKSYRNDIREFLDFLYSTKGHFDNTVSMHTKNLNSYLKWLEKRLGIDIIKYCEDYMVPSHPIPVVVLSEERLSFLMYNMEFQASLCPRLQFAKDILVFGCITGLRVSDLLNLRKTSLEKFDGQLYVRVTASKTEIESRICLPPIAVDILERNNQKRKSKIFRPIGASNLNAYMKEIAFLAGWTEETPKYRKKRGKSVLQYRDEKKKQVHRFCDIISTHIMRRTAITSMINSGIKEEHVRRMSGHSPGSKSFYRYVQYCQDTMDQEVLAMHKRIEKSAYFSQKLQKTRNGNAS